MKSYIVPLLFILSFSSCKESVKEKIEDLNIQEQQLFPSIQEKIANLKNSKNKDIIVIAHRGDWRNAPENSLQAIQRCIDIDVDMVEIDIRETKDGHLVLMHDDTIGRTTTGKGYVKEWTLDSLKTIRLIDGLGVATQHKIPTLQEALELAKGKILINLDKSYQIFDKCYEVIKQTNTQDQVIIKGVKRKQEVEKEFGAYLGKVHFMPIIVLPNPDAKEIIDDYLESKTPPVAFEFVLKGGAVKEVMSEFKNIRAAGSSIWVNSLWPHFNEGHDDEKAAINSTIYQWYIDNDIDMIQTDRPALLLEYLRAKGLHN
ncbi:glycerophosphodiester phosphodiesterase family protein [Flavivirga spongiicola]|uniref:Glycerophosphodiester phosphodiesterase family protein n=1 Tax=Flavivirga spongiicola TaxID=421621 RepID=A0ABU7XNW4_9FLAO|nr:glycerophosphodiester phosphodiesterase family protein [Flavivirga sp. MEBiC05379]MDO5977465.1 glycerophosphodiester phosphodiesterase family protein [Flavivirga sp. MEBiC05379]